MRSTTYLKCAERELNEEIEDALRANLEEELAYYRGIGSDAVSFEEGQRLGEQHFSANDARTDVVLGRQSLDILSTQSE